MKITIDNHQYGCIQNETILDVANRNGLYIPSLCAHPELTPYGGCRMCVVEIEGFKSYPTACTTRVEEGMIIRTDTKELKEIRTELIQLILSEHPAACLICEDVDGCRGYQETIRKVGITTGCRWCPKDQDCEFQRIVESLDITDLTLPGLYRDLPLEKYDPFYDRDYNLCIYCGKCVRICEESRKSSVLSLKQRGKQTTIGPAFEASHVEANCEFCGACVSVCPTGAMSEKSRKWWGVPDSSSNSVCPLCSLNCEIQVLSLKDLVVGTAPPGKLHESGGDLCVKGRFCLSEILNRSKRILEPEFRYNEGYGIISWNKAIDETAKFLKDLKPMRTAMFLSPGLSLEEIDLACKFASNTLGTNLITSSCIDDLMLQYMAMARESVSLKEISKSDLIISVFLNGNYSYAPLTLAIKDLATRGVPFHNIGWIMDTTSRFAGSKTIPTPGNELDSIDNLRKMLDNHKKPVLVVGPEVLSLTNGRSILDTLREVVKESGASLIMPNPYGNLEGLLSLANYYPCSQVESLMQQGKIDLLYLVGDTPFTERPGIDKIIYQGAFPTSTGLEPDIVLPAALWSENTGSYLDMFGKIIKAGTAAKAHGYALSHQQIFNKISKAMGKKAIRSSAKSIRETIINREPLPYLNTTENITLKPSANGFPFILIQEKGRHLYQNIELTKELEGLGELVSPDRLIINPRDAGSMGIVNGDPLEIRSDGTTLECFAEIRKTIIPGHVLMYSSANKFEFETNPCPVKITKQDV